MSASGGARAAWGAWRLETDTKKFEEALREFQEASKKSVAQNLKEQARLLVKDVAMRTPPGDFSGGKWKRTAGEKLIKVDLAKIMKPTNLPGTRKNPTRTDPARIHKQYRRGRGRVVTNLKGDRSLGGKDTRFRVEKSTLEIYRQQVLKRVGYMASGWKAAILRLGGTLPAWIMRHNAPGNGEVFVNGDAVGFAITNFAVYPESRGLVERRASASLKKRYWQMIKRVDFAAKQAAERSGFIVGGS